MAKKGSRSIYEEYKNVKQVISKMYKRAKESRGILDRKKHLMRVEKLKCRLRRIEKVCSESGLPHPEAKSTRGLSDGLFKDPIKTVSRAMMLPDGNLYQAHKGPFTSGYIEKRLNPNGDLLRVPKQIDRSFIREDSEI